MIKKLEKVCEAFEFKCIEMCRDKKTGLSTPAENKDTSILVTKNNSYVMFKEDIYIVQEIMKVVLGDIEDD